MSGSDLCIPRNETVWPPYIQNRIIIFSRFPQSTFPHLIHNLLTEQFKRQVHSVLYSLQHKNSKKKTTWCSYRKTLHIECTVLKIRFICDRFIYLQEQSAYFIAHRYIKVGIWNEAAQFNFWEYMNRISVHSTQ
jgi:hypothetical protein